MCVSFSVRRVGTEVSSEERPAKTTPGSIKIPLWEGGNKSIFHRIFPAFVVQIKLPRVSSSVYLSTEA